MMDETNNNDNVCGGKLISKVDEYPRVQKSEMRHTQSGTEIQEEKYAFQYVASKMRKNTSCPGQMYMESVSIGTDDSDSEGGISITVPSESELSTSLGRDDTSHDFIMMASGTSSEQIDMDDDWEAITHLWQDIENDKRRYDASVVRHTLKHSISSPPPVQHRVPRAERSYSLPGNSGVDQLERLVKLMEELSELKKQNLELKKHSDYLEAMKNLQEMKNECLAMHCSCSAAQRFLKPGSVSFDIDLTFEENSLESESITAGVEETYGAEVERHQTTKHERKSRRTLNKNFEMQRKRSRSVEIGPGAADALVQEMHKRSLSRWERVKEKLSGTKHVSVKHKKSHKLTSRQSAPAIASCRDAADDSEVLARAEDITETKSIDSGAYFETEENHRRRKRLISNSRQSDLSENEETFYESKSSNWLEVHSYFTKTRKDSDLSTSSSDFDLTFESESRGRKERTKRDLEFVAHRHRRKSSPHVHQEHKQDSQLNRSSSLQEKGVTENTGHPHGNDGHDSKGKSLTLGKMKDIILRKESGKRKSKKHGSEQDSSKDLLKDAAVSLGSEDASRPEDASVTVPTTFSPTSSFKRKHKKHTADDLPVQEERELPFLSPKATRKSFRTKDSSSAAHKKVKGWDKVKQALVKKDASSSGGKGKAQAMDDSILSALRGENVDLTTLLGGVSEEFTRKMEEWETRKQKKSSGSNSSGPGSPGAKRKVARVRSTSPPSVADGAVFSPGIDWSSPVMSAQDYYEAAQANLSDKFRKKLSEWEKKQNKLSASCPSPLERLKSVSNETSPTETSPQLSVEELQKNISDKFSKKIEEWERKKQRGVSMKEKRERHDPEERRTKSESVPETASRVEIYSTDSVTVFKTREGRLEYEGVSEEFEKKLAQWEKKKHLKVPPAGDTDAKAHRVDTVGDSETAPPSMRKFSDGAISLASNKLELSSRSRTRSRTGSLDSDDTDISSVFQSSPVTPVIVEPESAVLLFADHGLHIVGVEQPSDKTATVNGPTHSSTPISASESQRDHKSTGEESLSKVLLDKKTGSETELKSLRDECVFVDILSEDQCRELEERNKRLSADLKQKNGNLDQLKSELEKCQREINILNHQHRKQLDNYRKVITSGEFTESTQQTPSLDTSLQYLQEQIRELESYGQRTQEDKSTLESTVMDQRLKYEKTIAKLQAEVTNLRHINLQLVSEYSNHDRVLQGEEVALLLKNAQDMQKAQDTIAILHTKLRNLQLAMLHKDKFISDMEWNLMDREAYIAILQSEVDTQAAELSYFKTMRDSGVLRRVRSFGARGKTYLDSQHTPSPIKSPPSKFTTKTTKSEVDAGLKEIYELTNSLEGKISTCEKSNYTAIPSVSCTPKSQTTESSPESLLISEAVPTELHPVTMTTAAAELPTARDKRRKWLESRDPETGSPVLKRKVTKEEGNEGEKNTETDDITQGKRMRPANSIEWSTVDIPLESETNMDASKKDGGMVQPEKAEKSTMEEEIPKLEPLVISEPVVIEDAEVSKVTMEERTVKISSPEIQKMPKPLKVYEVKKAPSLLCCGSVHKHSITSTSSSEEDLRPWPASSRSSSELREKADSSHHLGQLHSALAVKRSMDEIAESVSTFHMKSSVSNEEVRSTSACLKEPVDKCIRSVSMEDQLHATQENTFQSGQPNHTQSTPNMRDSSNKQHLSIFSPVATRLSADTRATQSAEAGLDARVKVSDGPGSAGEDQPQTVSRNSSQEQIQKRIDSIITRSAVQRRGAKAQEKRDNLQKGQVRSRSVIREDRSRGERKVTPPRDKTEQDTGRTRRSMSVPAVSRSPAAVRSASSVDRTTPSLSTKKMISLSPKIERVRLAKSPVRHVHVDMSVASRAGRRDSDKGRDDSSVSSLESITKTEQKENITPSPQPKINKSLTITMELRPRSASVGSRVSRSNSDKSLESRNSSGESSPSKVENSTTVTPSSEVKDSSVKPPLLKMKLSQLHNLGNVKDIRKKFSDLQYSSSPSVLQLLDDKSAPARNEKQSSGSGGRVKELSQAFSAGLADKKGSRGNSPSSSANNVNKSVSKHVELFQKSKSGTPEAKRKTMPGISILRIRQPLSQDKDSGSDSPCDSPILGRKGLQLAERRKSGPEGKSGSSSSFDNHESGSRTATRKEDKVDAKSPVVNDGSSTPSGVSGNEKRDVSTLTYKRIPASPKLWSSRIREPQISPRSNSEKPSVSHLSGETKSRQSEVTSPSKDRSKQSPVKSATYDDAAKDNVSLSKRSLGSKQTLPSRPKLSHIPAVKSDSDGSNQLTDTSENRTPFKLKRDVTSSPGGKTTSSEPPKANSTPSSERASKDNNLKSPKSGDTVTVVWTPQAAERAGVKSQSGEVKSGSDSPRVQSSNREDKRSGWFSKKLFKGTNDDDDLHAPRLHTDDNVEAS